MKYKLIGKEITEINAEYAKKDNITNKERRYRTLVHVNLNYY